MLFQRPRRLALHSPHAKQEEGGGFKHKGTTFERNNQEQLSAISVTSGTCLSSRDCLMVAAYGQQGRHPLLWAASGGPLGQIKSPFAASKQHSHNGKSAWWFTLLLKIRHLGLSNPHWKFWEILELLGVWIQGWQHYLLHQEKIKQDKWNPCETTEAGVHMKVWYILQSLQP